MILHLAVLLLLQTSKAQNTFMYELIQDDDYTPTCPSDDWTIIGADCYLPVSHIHLRQQEAAHYCTSLGSKLLELTETWFNNEIGAQLESDTQFVEKGWWIGMQYTGDPQNSPTSTPARWLSGDVTDLKAAPLWGYSEPDVTKGSCVKVKRRDDGSFPWEMTSCEAELPFICVASACLQGQFHCLNGRCISDEKMCDRWDDCGDNSDQRHCDSGLPCNKLLTDPVNADFSSNSGNSRVANDCQWSIEGEYGATIRLHFTDFRTELGHEFVNIYEGGKTISTSRHVAQLSGTPSGVADYVSSNHLMIVTFFSETPQQNRGISATWSTVFPCSMATARGNRIPELSDATMSIRSQTDCQSRCLNSNTCQSYSWHEESRACYHLDDINIPVTDKAYLYGVKRCPDQNGASNVDFLPADGREVSVLPNRENLLISPQIYSGMKVVWILDTGASDKIITLQMFGVDIGTEDTLVIRDGGDELDAVIAKYTGEGDNDEAYQFVMTTQQRAYLELTTQQVLENNRPAGFILSYKQGCDVNMEVDSGVIQSPGYLAGANLLPEGLQCSWSISNRLGLPASLLFTDDFDLGAAELQIYVGDDSSPQTAQSHTPPAREDVDSSTGEYVIQFTTSTSGQVRGFHAIYSINCLGFEIDGTTSSITTTDPSGITIADFSAADSRLLRYGGTVTIMCLTGYYLRHEAFTDNDMSATMTCGIRGMYEDYLVPKCEFRKCEFPASIANGYVDSYDALGRGTVTYACFDGFTRDPSAGQFVVNCLDTGDWEMLPVCQAEQCDPPRQELPDHMTQEVTPDEGNLRFGTLVRYSCNDGYTLDGAPYFIYCRSSGSWSSDVADLRCIANQCAVPNIENGDYQENNAPGTPVDFGTTLTVVCDSGYQLMGDNTAITCLANSTFGENIPTCHEIDECADSNPCEHADLCTNTPGSYMCGCPDGYTLQAGSQTHCEDIDECTQDTHGCEDADECSNTDGGYDCGCASGGYTVFTENNDMGYQKYTRDTGYMAGDVLRYDHSCVKKACTRFNIVPENAQLMIPNEQQQEFWYYGDSITVLCDYGFTAQSITMDTLSYTVTCGDDGEWEYEGTAIGDVSDMAACVAITCAAYTAPDDIDNPPQTAAPDGTTTLGQTVTLTCTHAYLDPPPDPKTQECGFDYETQTYKLIGDVPDCGVARCGDFPVISGSDPNRFIPPTDDIYYSDHHTAVVLVCRDGTEPSGESLHGDQLITAPSPYKISCYYDPVTKGVFWDVGSLACQGESCSDLGAPPGGHQVDPVAYQDGVTVTFACDETGYEPTAATTVCNNGSWNPSALPECVDVQAPTCLLCDPQAAEEVLVDMYYPLASLTQRVTQQCTDNTGIHSVTPSLDDPNHLFTVQTDVTYIIRDYAGGQTQCLKTVKILSNTASLFTDECNNGNATIVILPEDASSIDVAVPPPAVGDGVTVVTSPQEVITFTEAHLNTVTVVTHTATVGEHSAQCRIQYLIKAAACSERELPDPSNTDDTALTCETTGTAKTCTFQCRSGFYFYVDGNEVNEKSITCDTATGEWSDTQLSGCVESIVAPYKLQYTMTYNTTSDLECEHHYTDSLNEKLRIAASNLQESCTVGLTVSSSDVISTVYDQVGQQHTFSFEFTTGPNSLSERTRKFCAERIAPSMKIVHINDEEDLAGVYELKHVTSTSDVVSCPTAIANSISPVRNHSLTCSTGLLVEDKCVPCASGTYYNGNVCAPCARGYYSQAVGQAACTPCPQGMSTFYTGTISEELCYAQCPPGFRSDTGLAPCQPCGVDMYWTDATTCTACPSTDGQNAAANQEECKSQCPAGSVSGSGYQPCQPCPVGYYSDAPGASSCTECQPGTSTAEEGSTSQSQCTNSDDILCSVVVCQNEGTCQVSNYRAECSCPDGYTGSRCEQQVNACQSDPCYNNGVCTNDGDGYTCTCSSRDDYSEESRRVPNTGEYHSAGSAADCKTSCTDRGDACKCFAFSGGICYYYSEALCVDTEGRSAQMVYIKADIPVLLYNGDRCQTVAENKCTDGICGEHGICRNTVIDVQCLCIGAYTGDRCESRTENACDIEDTPCMHGGQCHTISDSRWYCVCAPGYTGLRCDVTIDYCKPNPCLYGGVCIPEVDGFSCACPEGYGALNAGRNICSRPANICNNINCDNAGTCFQYYQKSSAKCVCGTGYRNENYYTEWFNDSTNVTHQIETPQQHATSQNPLCADGYTVESVQCREMDTMINFNETGDVFETGYDCTTNGLKCLRESQEPESDCSDYEVRYYCTSPSTKCNRINKCYENPCKNRAPYTGCSLTNIVAGQTNPRPKDRYPHDAYQCTCEPGYEGHNCQHEIDECAREPCENGGTCEDMVNSYTCTCRDGYTGSTCETDIDDCDSDPCQNGGQCHDGVDHYVCDCPAGYSGSSCQTDTEECDSSPCLNGGRCVDQIDGYQCTCEDGWEGDRCKTQVDTCGENDPCNQETGTCHSVFGDTFCECVAGSTGDTCEITRATCDITPNDICSNGAACQGNTCQCPEGFSGSTCDRERDYCDDENGVCENGGECKHDDSDAGYTCYCAPGFRGTHCETEIQECDYLNCASGSTCVDLDGYAYCRCPTDKTGRLCNKNIDRDHDLVFDGKTGSEFPYPRFFNQSKLSVSLWMRTTRADAVFLCIYKADSEKDLEIAPESKMLCITAAGVTVYKDQQTPQTVDYSTISTPTNGDWQAIVVAWNLKTRDIYAKVASIGANNELREDFADYPVPEYLLVTLGWDGEDSGRILQGSVSRVNIWNTYLTVQQVADLSERDDDEDMYSAGVVFPWSGYTIQSTVTRRQPSQICAPGMCFADGLLVEPRLVEDTCPADMVEGTGDPFSVTWRSPAFTGATDLIQQYDQQNPNVRLNPGIYDILHIGVNADTSSAQCRFTVTVRGGDCVTPEASSPQVLWCSDLVNGVYTGCEMSCDDGYGVLHPIPRLFTCGDSGTWAGEATLRLPGCGELDTAFIKVDFSWIYDIPNLSTVEQTLLGALRSSFVTWSEQQDPAFCSNSACSDLQIEAAQQDDDTVLMTCSLPKTNKLNSDDVEVVDALRTAITQDDSIIYLNEIGGANTYEDLQIEYVVFCNEGHQAVLEQCVACTAGTYYDSDTETCVPCAKGTYQEGTEAKNCTMCPEDHTTAGEGATSADACFDACPVGRFYNSDIMECEPCGYGKYQNQTQQSECFDCPNLYTTYETGSDSKEDCKPDCIAGEIFDENKACVACAQGTYRQQGERNCTACPEDFTTAGEGAGSVADCNIVVCPAGEYRREDINMCEDCWIGSYRTAEQSNCTECGEGLTTENAGAESVNMCILSCPAGFFKLTEGDNDPECKECPQGQYKTDDEEQRLASECTDCPDGMTTWTSGAGSEDACVFGTCTAGQIYNNMTDACENCPIGSYQPDSTPTHHMCIPCSDGKTTREAGADAIDDCEAFCPAGEFLHRDDNNDLACEKCAQGAYKTGALDQRFTLMCSACPNGKTTWTDGAVSDEYCVFDTCTAGQIYNNMTEACEDCPVGTYQPEPTPTHHQCMPCSDEKTTQDVGSDSADDCKDYCPSGQEWQVDQCVRCGRMYYKDNGADDANALGDCILCPTGFIAENAGAIHADNCTVHACEAGHKIGADGCVPCPKEEYQDDKWQTACKPCPPDTTAAEPGSTSPDNCTETPYFDHFSAKLTLIDLEYNDDLANNESEAYQQLEREVLSEVKIELNKTSGFKSVTLEGFSRGSVITHLNIQQDNRETDDTQLQITQALQRVTSDGQVGGHVVRGFDPGADLVNLGSTTVTCDPGEQISYSDEASTCVACPKNTYSSTSGSVCTECPTGTGTSESGKIALSDCQSLCDLEQDVYCNNHGTCVWSVLNGARCFCHQFYEGDRCQTRSDPQDDQPLIIGFSIGALAVLLAIVLIYLLIYRLHTDPYVKENQKKRRTGSKTHKGSHSVDNTLSPHAGMMGGAYYPMGVGGASPHPARIYPPSQLVGGAQQLQQQQQQPSFSWMEGFYGMNEDSGDIQYSQNSGPKRQPVAPGSAVFSR